MRNLAQPLLYLLSTNRTFNFSKYLFDNMVSNVKSRYEFLMYPRFVKTVLQEHQLQPHKNIYPTPCLQQKVFQNMNRATRGNNGVVVALLPTMLTQVQQVQGEGPVNPTEPQHTPEIVVPSTSYTTPVTHSFRRRTRKEAMVPQPSSPPQTYVAD